MKKILIVLASLSALNAFAALPPGGIGPALVPIEVCSTPQSPLHGFTAVRISNEDGYAATLSGDVSGGAAHFMTLIGPYNVKVSFDGDTKIYSNSEEGIELTVHYGAKRTTATFKQGDESLSMTCSLQHV